MAAMTSAKGSVELARRVPMTSLARCIYTAQIMIQGYSYLLFKKSSEVCDRTFNSRLIREISEPVFMHDLMDNG